MATKHDDVCIDCANHRLSLETRGMRVAHARCACCGRLGLTVDVTNLPDRFRFVEPPAPPPPTPAQVACGTWIDEQVTRSLNFADESVTLKDLPNLIQRIMVRAFHAGWEAREKIAEDEKQQLRDEISEQVERRSMD